MRIIQERAEENLIQKLRTGLRLYDIRHVLHVRGQAVAQKDFDALPELMDRLIGETAGELYICHDRDIFVFSPNLSVKIFAQIKESLHEAMLQGFTVHSKLLSFYDIENNALGLIELAEAKLAKRIEAEKKEAAKRRAENKTQQKSAFQEINPVPGVAFALDKRRTMRAGLEILVVEDDPFSRKLISGVLSDYGVSFAENGCDAISGYLQKAPDIVFLDIDLPDVTGHDVLTKIRSFDREAYIIMLSGNSQAENVKEAIHAGARGFVAKPFTKEKLLQYIAKCPKNHFV